MFVVPGQPQVKSVADGILVLKEDVQATVFEFFRNLQIALLENVISGKFSPGSIRDVALDAGADVGRGLVREWVHFIFSKFHETHYVIPLDSDLVRGTVLDDNLAVLVAVNAD
jgi:hypothetical protein